MPETPPHLPEPSLHELIVITEELARLAEQGLSLEMGLDWLSEEGARKLRAFSSVLKEHLDKGEPLDIALAQTADLPKPYLELVRLGLAGNQPAEVLRTLLWSLRGLASLRKLVAATVIYPLFVCFISLGVFLGYCCWAAPALERISTDIGMSGVSTAILAVCAAIGRYWSTGAVIGYGLLVVATAAVALGIRSIGRAFDAKRRPAVLLFPSVYQLYRIQQAVTGSRLLAICLEQGLTPAEALRSVAVLTPGDETWRKRLRMSADAVEKGSSVAIRFPNAPGSVVITPEGDAPTLSRRLFDYAARWQRVAETRMTILRSLLPIRVGWIAVLLVGIVYAVYWIPYVQLLYHLMFAANTI